MPACMPAGLEVDQRKVEVIVALRAQQGARQQVLRLRQIRRLKRNDLDLVRISGDPFRNGTVEVLRRNSLLAASLLM